MSQNPDGNTIHEKSNFVGILIKNTDITNARTTFEYLFEYFNNVPHFQAYNPNNVHMWMKWQIIIPIIPTI